MSILIFTNLNNFYLIWIYIGFYNVHHSQGDDITNCHRQIRTDTNHLFSLIKEFVPGPLL